MHLRKNTAKGTWRNYFDVVLLPPPSVRDHAIELSRKLQDFGGEFVLGTRRFLPHLSIYHIPVRPPDFVKFSRAVRDVAARHSGGTLRLRSIEMPLLMTGKPPWLAWLHRDMVAQTRAFFDRSYGAEQLWDLRKIPAPLRTRAQQNLLRWGSPMIGSLFRPHITLTSFKGAPAKSIALRFEPMVFDIREVAICELGEHHTCRRLIATYPLAHNKNSHALKK